jgi:hypothetical protein
MSPVKLSLLSAVVAITAVSVWCRGERRARISEAHSLRAANAGLQTEAARRHQSSATRTAVSDTPARKSSTTNSASAEESPAQSASGDYRFEGQATPLNTLQTMAWALDRGDVELMMNVITFDEAARRKFEAYQASLPAEARAQWSTTEQLAATLLTKRGINHPYPRSDLLARATVEPVSAERVVVRLPGTPKDREVYQKVGDTWRWVITEQLVDAFLKTVAQPRRP